MHLKYKLIFILSILSFIGFSKKDSTKSQVISTNSYNNSDCKHLSIKGDFFINGGIGESTILYALTGNLHGNGPLGGTQSFVYNGIIDYGISKNMTFGIGAAYQRASDTSVSQMTSLQVENFSRLNLSARVLFYLLCKRHLDIYYGIRGGISFLKEVITPSMTTSDQTNLINLSLQGLMGIRFYTGPIGIHFEAAIGTPYFAEGGLTFIIVTKKETMQENGQSNK
ncbi:MAG: hypothetical protein ACLQQ4_04115 [Bacteroidia bacterium]